MNLYKSLYRLAAAAVLFTAVACGGDDDDSDIDFKPVPGEPATPKGKVAGRLEVPALKSGNRLISHWTTKGDDSVMTYCLEYDPAKYHSRWVAFRFDGDTRARNVGRKDYNIRPQYPADPDLPAQYAIEDDASFNDNGYGYDHGHLCASYDRLYSREANDQTFYMTNMSPQLSNFNQHYWKVLEEFVQKKGRDASFADTLYVCKGGTIEDRKGKEQVLKYVCRNRVPVPKYYFLALLKVKNGNYTSIAFALEHKDYGRNEPATSAMERHAVSVDSLERLTGIDFFHNLPDNIENATEKLRLPAAWGL